MQTMSLEDLEQALRDHLTLVNEGKARDSFTNPLELGVRYIYVSDRISSHDHILPFKMRRHGEVRNASTIYWKRKLENAGMVIDLISCGRDIDDWLPEELKGIPELWKRMTIVEEADMDLVENIGRSRLLGSAARQYFNLANNRIVYGQELPKDLQLGDELDPPLWTPTTKAPPGEHDMPLAAADVDGVYPEHKPLTLAVLGLMNEVSMHTGVAFYADTKLEFGRHKKTKKLMVCDEVGSFDSSRIWPIDAARAWPRGNPGIGIDKDFVRVEMERLGIKDHSPSTEEGQAAVKVLRPTDSFIREAEDLSLLSFAATTGQSLEEFQQVTLGIPE